MCKYFSMFSGIGGFELGILRAQYAHISKKPEQKKRQQGRFGAIDEQELSVLLGNNTPLCIGYSEIDKYAIKVYERQFNGHTNYGDATAINPAELPDFNLLVGGFPCQAFSIAGKRHGFNDTRGTLFFDIARVLSEKRPRHLVLENVKGLLSHDGGKTFQTILGVLADLGYRVEWQLLNSKDFGVPQNRERVYIVGHLREKCGRKILPIGSSYQSDVQQGVLAHTINSSDWRGANRNQKQTTIRTDESPTPQGGHQSNGTNRIRRASYTDGARVRRLTPKECERLQGFPDDWTAGESDTQRYKMCGNAVTVNVVEAVMSNLMPCLQELNNEAI